MRDMILAGIVNSLIGAVSTVSLVAIAFVGRRFWLRYGPRSGISRSVTWKSKYTCPRCGESAVISPVREEERP